MTLTTLEQIFFIAAGIGTLAGAWKVLAPTLKLTGRVANLEKNQTKIFDLLDKMRDESKIADRLLVKAMVEVVDNRITDNNVENLKTTKNELMEFLRDN